MTDLEKAMEQTRVNTLRMRELEQVQREYEAAARKAHEERMSLKLANENLSVQIGTIRELSEAAKTKAEYEKLKQEYEAKLLELAKKEVPGA